MGDQVGGSEQARVEHGCPGPLRVHPRNPRYFADPSGSLVYLTGVHTWHSLQERQQEGFNPVFDYPTYLDFLTRHGHNCFRKWVWEFSIGAPWTNDEVRMSPMPYERSEMPGALDGGNKFDLGVFHEQFFDRLSDRVRQAEQRGIYVIIVLFNGAIGDVGWPAGGKNPWRGHPFHRDNNVNGVDGDPEETGQGFGVHTSGHSATVWEYQKAYIRKVLDLLNDCDNVLYEVCNEDQFPGAARWQYDVIDYIHEYEAGMPKKHPAGMSAIWNGPSADLYESPADWIGPAGVADCPFIADCRKVIIWDSDHTIPGPVTPSQVWKAFTRGHNVLSMEHDRDGNALLAANGFDPIPGDRAMGRVARLAETLDLAAMVPLPEIASTGYCLAEVGRQYVVFQPWKMPFGVRLADGAYTARWLDPAEDRDFDSPTVHGGGNMLFTAPFDGEAMLHLSRIDNEN